MGLADPLNDRGRSGVGSTKLGVLLDAIGPSVLRLHAPITTGEPRTDRDVEVKSVVLHDPLDELHDHRAAMLLLTGVRADSSLAADLVDSAARHRFCAVVVKGHGGDVQQLAERAALANVSLLTTPDELSWTQLEGILLTVLGSRGAVDETLPADGEELFAIANAISMQIGGSVTVEDIDKRILAYSSSTTQRIDAVREQGILERQVPQADRNALQYLAVLAADGCVRFPPTADELARVAISIKVGHRPLGTIWAIDGADGLDHDGERALSDGADLAARTMLRSHLHSRSELLRRESALLRALDGSLSAAEIDFRLSRRGGDILTLVGFAPVGVAQIGTADGGADITISPSGAQLANELAQHLAAYRPDASMAGTERAVYVMLPAADAASAARFAERALKASNRAFTGAVCAAISASSTDAERLPAMRREVDGILRVLTTRPNQPLVASIGGVRLEVLLAHLADTVDHDPGLRHAGADEMVAYDHERSTQYVESFQAWIDALGDIAAAARSLGIHANTLRYRLRRIEDLFSIPIDVPDERLAIWLQLRMDGPEAIPTAT